MDKLFGHSGVPTFAYKVALVCATMIWGLSFVVMKDSVETITPAWLIGIRFVASGVILACFCVRKFPGQMRRDLLLRGSLCGAVLFLAFWCQTIGLTDTTPGKNAFLTATYCVIVPFAWWVVVRRRPTAFNIVAAVMCVAGIGCVSLGDDFSIRYGDAMTLLGALLFAVHIVLVAKFAEGMDAYVLTVYQFLAGGLLGVVIALCSEPLPAVSTFSADFIGNMIYLIVFASLIALLIQNVALAHVPPAQASLFLSLESVFGVLFYILLYGEQVTVRLALGFVLIFLAIVVSEAGPTIFARVRQGRQVLNMPQDSRSNIVLIGFPSSGKTTVGKNLARTLGMSFMDADEVIMETYGKTLEQIIDEEGPEGFIRVEGRILAGLDACNTVVATGGSAIYSDQAMAHLRKIGVVVYLEVGYADMAHRVGDVRKRGVVLKDGMGMSLQDLWDERQPLYERYAEVTVNTHGIGVSASTDKVANCIAEYRSTGAAAAQEVAAKE